MTAENKQDEQSSETKEGELKASPQQQATSQPDPREERLGLLSEDPKFL